MDDVIIRIIDLPPPYEGFVLEDPAGDYNIYINGRLTFKRQQEVYVHETAHFKHLHSDLPVELCEYEAQSKSARCNGRSCKNDDDRLVKSTRSITQGAENGK